MTNVRTIRVSDRARVRAPELAVAGVLLVVIAVVAACFWPGHMNADTLTQLGQARDGRYTNQHAPILMWLYHPLYVHGIGPGFILVGQLLTFVGGVYLLLRTTLSRRWATTAAVLIVAYPPVFGMLGGVTRDVWFTALLVLTYGLTARAITSAWPRAAWYVAAALAAAWLSSASRQNAGFGLLPALAVLAWVVLSGRGRAPRAWVAAGLGIAATLAIVVSQIGLSTALPIKDISPQQYLYDYDLGAMSVDENRNLFPPSALPSRSLAQIRSHWQPAGMSGLTWTADAPVRSPLDPKAAGQLQHAWRDAVTRHPGDYLQARTMLFGRMLAWDSPAIWVFHPRIDANDFGYRIRFTGLNGDAKSYLSAFSDPGLYGGPLYTVWIYLLVAAGLAIVLLRGRSAVLILAGGLALSAELMQVGLFVGSPVAEFRFEFPAVVATLVAAAVALGARRRTQAGVAS